MMKIPLEEGNKEEGNKEEGNKEEGNKEEGKNNKKLVDVPLHSQQDALQLIAHFLTLAQRRGAFTFDESAKIWECLQHFS